VLQLSELNSKHSKQRVQQVENVTVDIMYVYGHCLLYGNPSDTTVYSVVSEVNTVDKEAEQFHTQ
jgi:hypothetical protein